MNRNRILLGLGLALVVAFLASRYVYVQLRQAQMAAAVVKPMKLTPVVVAAGPLKMGQRLGADDLKLVDWPEGKQPKGTFSRREDCVGRALIVPLAENEAILEERLASREAGSGLAVVIPLGMRAVSVGVDDVVAVAGFVTPGTLVDVLVTGAGPAGPVTRTILEHIRVLAVGQQVQTDSSGKPQTAPVVTLLVTPDEAQRLTLAAAEGRIHLALRNAADTANANPPPAQGAAMFVGPAPLPVARKIAPKAARRAAPPPPYKVQVIQGDKVETQTFPP
jgi:pilus assembly protein CpaB